MRSEPTPFLSEKTDAQMREREDLVLFGDERVPDFFADQEPVNAVHGIIVGVAMLDLLSAISACLPECPRRARTRVSPVTEVHEAHDDGVADLI